MTQEVAYESLQSSTRATLHGQLAKDIEREYQQSPEQFVDLLAFHYLRGQEWEKALQYNLMAAQAAQREFANDSAMIACQRALDSASRLADEQDTSEGASLGNQLIADIHAVKDFKRKLLWGYGHFM